MRQLLQYVDQGRIQYFTRRVRFEENMTIVERESVLRVCMGALLQRGPGAAQGIRGKAPESESILAFPRPKQR